MTSTQQAVGTAWERILAGVPVDERRVELAGVATAVLEGGDGSPMVLLHGPGEFAASWLPVLPDLLRSHRVITPDLPGHGASGPADGPLDVDLMVRWLAALIEHTCATPPVVVGRIVGGAIGARFAAAHPGALAGLVLVDTLGLVPLEPAPRFTLAMRRYFEAPTALSFDRFMEFCTFDLDGVRERLGQRWEAYSGYAIELANRPSTQAALGQLIEHFAMAPIPPAELDRIDVPTALIWGRHDLATPLTVAQAASKRYGWPLQVIEDAGDDPQLDQPRPFLTALRTALTSMVEA